MNRGSFLSVDNGFLVCTMPDKQEKRIPLQDIRGIIAGIQGIGFSNECIARLLEQDSVILHCNNKYKPVGWSVSLDRVIRDECFKNQINRNTIFENELWDKLIKHKMHHQSLVLDIMNCENPLKEIITHKKVDEGHVAKKYWQHYFTGLGNPQNREHQNAQSFENIALNYSYAVIMTLVHRSILIHGLLPSLGVHHSIKYRSTPLVYDLLEPVRGFADLFLYNYQKWNKDDFNTKNLKLWVRYFSSNLKDCKIEYKNKKVKFIDAIDVYVNSVAQAFIEYNVDPVWIPDISNHLISKDNNESEE